MQPFLAILISVVSMSAGSRFAKSLATGLGVVLAAGALVAAWWVFVPSPRRTFRFLSLDDALRERRHPRDPRRATSPGRSVRDAGQAAVR